MSPMLSLDTERASDGVKDGGGPSKKTNVAVPFPRVMRSPDWSLALLTFRPLSNVP